ncbi:phage major capsid protein [uncultured Microbulbifer sp.]|uniref:phage major capsid protein n=1 Tax=uncultured Microbulbifer sp. TaxID=348147 RepID=UPI0026152BB4|nr:phage major capsid protein [uncultured Microbulbifer sp.]
MSKLLDLQQKRGQLAASMRTLVDSVDAAKGMTTDQESQWKTMNDDLNALDKQVEQLEKMEQIEARLGEVPEPARRPEPNANATKNPLETDEYRNNYEQYIRGGMTPEIRGALTVGTEEKGGILVPIEWRKELIESLTDAVVMRNICTVISTSSTTTLPLLADYGSAGWLDEGAPYPESDIEFGSGVLEAWKLGRIIKVSEELLEDNQINLASEIARIFGLTFGIAEDEGFIVGNGTKKATGVLETAEIGKVAASATAFTYQEIIDLIYSVRAVHRKGASFLMGDSTTGMMRKLTSTEGVPLWQPSLQAGEPDTFLGYKIHTSEAVPNVATGNKSMAFGNFKQYRIADRGGIMMQRLDEKYADSGHVGFRMRKRVDGKLLIPEAIKTLQQG